MRSLKSNDGDDENKENNESLDALKQSLKIANNGNVPNVVSMVANIDDVDGERTGNLYAINAFLQNKNIRIALNESLGGSIKYKSYEKQLKYLPIYDNMEKAILCWDCYRPKNNENIYCLVYKKINGEDIKIYPEIENIKEFKEWIGKKENAEFVYSCYGLINYGFAELGRIDDIKSHFIDKTIKTKKWAILKLINLHQFKNWNSWTIVDNNNNYDGNLGKLYIV